jgi:hypothetical protein
MSRELVAALVPIVVVVVIFVIALAVRGPVQGRIFAETGLKEWRHVAARLRWRDRWVLYWVNSWGQAAPRRLARLAVQRGEVMIAMIERTTRQQSRFRKLWPALGALSLLLCAANVATLVIGERRWDIWAQVPIQALLGVFFIRWFRMQRWQTDRLRRSVELSRRLLSED